MWFVIRKSTDGQYYFVLLAENNEVVATSETYTTKWSCQKTIDSIKDGVNPSSLVIDVAV